MGTASVSTGTMKGRSNDVIGARRVSYFRITLSNSYATGGESFDPKAFGHQGKVERIQLDPRYAAGASGPTGKAFLYDYTNKKVVVTVHSTGAEAANASDQSGVVIDVMVISD